MMNAVLLTRGGSAAAVEASESSPPAAQRAAPRGAPSSDEIREALLSFYYYAAAARGQRLPAPPVMAITDAAAILEGDWSLGSPGSQDRRRLAVGKLLAAWSPRSAPFVLTPTLIGVSLNTLGVPAAVQKQLEKCVEQYPQDPKGRELCAYTKLDLLQAEWKWTCCSCLEQCAVDQPEATALARVGFTIRVHRPWPELTPILDPQSWAECNPVFFDESCYDGTCPNADQQCNPPQPLGSVWSGVLFEKVGMQNSGATTSFSNDLKIETSTPSNLKYKVAYGLCLSVGNQIVEDCGHSTLQHVSLSNNTSFSRVGGIKRIKLTNTVQNGWLELALEAMVDQIARVSVCCKSQQKACEEKCKAATCALATPQFKWGQKPGLCK